jgi:hypothetical protein
MKTTQPTALDLLKEELMSQYDLTPDQISFEIKIRDVDREKARQIALDFSENKHTNNVNRENASVHYGWDKVPGLWVFASIKEVESDEE